ncbi:hypothetical protein BKA61DRAFT_236839 [Leptodontidium sp. MPI-SDFR-AT-0119]|nr:hypothetical protein BKA61DRAFT_236839 [Leptodontidium sp. MPI-SDFR-AT-0119]
MISLIWDAAQRDRDLVCIGRPGHAASPTHTSHFTYSISPSLQPSVGCFRLGIHASSRLVGHLLAFLELSISGIRISFSADTAEIERARFLHFTTHTHTATALLYVCFCFLYPHKSHRLYNASHHFTFRRIEPALFLRSFFCSLEPQQQHTPAHIRLPCLVLAPKKSVSITSPWWISDFHALCRLLWTRGLGWIPFFMRRME